MSARGYVRRSIEDRRSESNSVPAQQARIVELSRSHGWTLDKAEPFYVDEGGHGWDLARPGLVQMLHAAKAGEFDVLVLWRQDRLSRIEDIKAIVRALAYWGASVCFGDHSAVITAENLNNEMLALGVKAEVSAEELRKMREATKRGLAEALNSGTSLGRPPAGLRWGADGRAELNEAGQRAKANLDLSKLQLAGLLGVSPSAAWRIRKNVLAFADGTILAVLAKRTEAARRSAERVEEKAHRRRTEILAWLDSEVPTKWGR